MQTLNEFSLLLELEICILEFRISMNYLKIANRHWMWIYYQKEQIKLMTAAVLGHDNVFSNSSP